jgi:excisionase family DNA binding protein
MAADPPPSGPAEAADGLNLKQVAVRLGVHYMTAYRYVRQGRLAATQVGTGWLVSEAALANFTSQRHAPAPPDAAETTAADPRGVDWAGRLVPCLLAGDEPAAWRVVDAVLAGGHPVAYCYSDVLTASLTAIGARWQAGEVSIADQHIATAVATRLVARLGALTRRPGRSRGTVVFGAPSGELHSLPISIAADLVRLAGFDVLELGANVPPEAFALASQRAPRLVALGIGVTAAEHLPAAQATIDAVRAVDDAVPIIIGGQAAITAGGSGLAGVTAWAGGGPEAVTLIESLAGPGRRPRDMTPPVRAS